MGYYTCLYDVCVCVHVHVYIHYIRIDAQVMQVAATRTDCCQKYPAAGISKRERGLGPSRAVSRQRASAPPPSLRGNEGVPGKGSGCKRQLD